MKVWIDLSNSPHPLLFEPIAKRLEERGHVVCVTARDNAQTVELARERWPAVDVIGGPSPAGLGAKGRSILARVRALAGWARAASPDVALSHGSYAQIVAARMIGMPVVTAMDYEHQPANQLAFRLASRVLLPEALKGSRVSRQGASARKTRFYDGLKEEIYLGEFDPDPGILDAIGLEREPEAAIVMVRTPPSGALYHRSEGRLFLDALSAVARDGGNRCVVLARRPEQRRQIAALRLPNVILPEQAIDSRSLICASDLVVGAGGTMTREAALLGVPTVSVFAGKMPGVDRWLEERGALCRIRSPDELDIPRPGPPAHRDPGELRARGRQLVEDFVAVIEELGKDDARTLHTPINRRSQAINLARDLEAWGTECGWSGTDPYDGLNTTRPVLRPLKRNPLGRRLLIQAVKRSPLSLRPMLGIRPAVSAASVALVASSYARGGFLDGGEESRKLIDSLNLLEQLRSPAFAEPCWGYHFDFQSRAVFYRRGEPNTIATAFAGQALLDAYEVLQDDELLRMARQVGRFFLRHVPQTSTEHGAFFGYLPGDRTPIHNSNMLAGSLLARLANASGWAPQFADPARAALRFTVSRQREDGSWPYGETSGLGWVDNFHTGYVLDALRVYADAGVQRETAETAWRKGLHFYARQLFLKDGTPKYHPTSVYPLDSQCIAQGIQTFSRAARHEPAYADRAWRVLDFADRRMRASDGMPIFQRRRLWQNGAAHVRWVVAPLLLALADLLRIQENGSAVFDPDSAAEDRLPIGTPVDRRIRDPEMTGAA